MEVDREPDAGSFGRVRAFQARSFWARYGLAVAASAAVLPARLALSPILGDDAPFSLFVLSVAAAAVWGGLGPGLLATALGLALGHLVVLPLRPEPGWLARDLLHSALFAIEGGLIALLIEARRREARGAERGRQALAESRARLGVVVETAMDAIVVTDQAQNVIAFNPAAERMFGYSAGEVVGKPLSLLIPERFRQAHRAHVERFGTSGVAGRHMGALGVLSARRGDGGEFPIEATISQARQDGQTLYTAIVRDVTERERAAATLAEASQRQRRFVREMLHSITEGRLRLCESETDLPAPLPPASDAIDLTRPTLRLIRKSVEAVAEGLRLVKERQHDLETAVGEAAMNAVVHAGGGEGRIHADRQKGTVQVWIRDTGAGISQESLHRATMERGWTTAGSLGHGFWMMLKTCDRLYLLTGPGGTTVVLEQEREEPLPAWMQGL